MTLYEAVYTRKSIRNFRKDKVETSILEGMIQFYHEMEPLFPGIETSIELIDTQGSKKAKSRLGGMATLLVNKPIGQILTETEGEGEAICR